MTQQPNVTVETSVPGQQAVLVQAAVTGGEQVIAGVAGLVCAGPLGALASWGAIRSLQGKWGPWTVLGIVTSPILAVGQLVGLGLIGASLSDTSPSYTPPAQETSSASRYTDVCYFNGESTRALVIASSESDILRTEWSDGVVSVFEFHGNGVLTDERGGVWRLTQPEGSLYRAENVTNGNVIYCE